MFNGVFPPIPTPFDDQGRVDLGALRANIARWNETGLAGYVALGSNGEAPLLDTDESLAVVKTVRETMAPGMLLIVGTGRESTQATLLACQAAAGNGADAVLVITPWYYKRAMTGDALRRHYETVASSSPVPVLLYNMPANTGVNLAASTVSELASHPNIVGIKDSAGDIGQLSAILRSTPDNFAVMVGNTGAFLPGMLLGATGGILALANVAPRQTVALYQAAQSGRLAEARRLNEQLVPVGVAVTATYGIAGLKAALDLLGYAGGQPRPPLVPASPEAVEDIRRILETAGLLK
ncbi:MAG: dihydrodipicolinate synthase family protein [Anaerolineae bacterium]